MHPWLCAHSIKGKKIPLDAIPSVLYRLISIRLCLSFSHQAIKTNSLNVERAFYYSYR